MTTIEGYYKEIWSKAIEYIEEDRTILVDSIVIDTYFKPLQLMSLDNNIAVFVTDKVILKQVIAGYTNNINNALSLVIGSEVKCEVYLTSEYESAHKTKAIQSQLFFGEEEVEDEDLYQLKIKSELTFENFIVGNSNNECHAASLACAINPGKFYTPLFIYGNTGLGKTHLLNAIGNFVRKNYSDKVIYYTTGNDFVESVVSNIKRQSIDKFKRRLYNIDILLVDDIQFIAGREKSHEVFFSIFNELVNDRKQICITSDKHPTEIKGLEERLISRFSSGLSVGIDSPEFETSLAILKLKIKNQVSNSIKIDDEALSYIARNFSKDVRTLEGSLNRLLFMSINATNKDHIDLDAAISIFKGQITSTSSKELSVNRIKKEVADYYGLTKQQLVSKTRTSNISNARHIAMYLCRKLLDISYVKIGEEFGKRDHSTIMSACDKVEKKIMKETLYKQALDELERRVKGN